MALAGMIEKDEGALVCDLAEVYRIYDYRARPATFIATLALGLGDDSRIKLSLSESRVSFRDSLLCGILDRLTLIVYSFSEDSAKGRNRPKLLTEALFKGGDDEEVVFFSGKDFDRGRRMILKEFEEDD